MAAVTQLIPSYLGGVSKQTDQKKLPGQVRECLNAYPDPTFGLRKRPGLKFIKTLYESSNTSSPDLANAKWFFIKRDNEEKYIGCILDKDDSVHAAAPIRIWNSSGTACTVTYPDGVTYLDTTRDNYDILTVQDNSVITNKTKVVAKQAAPSYTLGSKATVRLYQVKYSCLYKVTVKIGSTTHTAEYTTIEKEAVPPAGPNGELVNTAEKILSELKSDLDALSLSGTLTTTQLEATLELSYVNSSGNAEAIEVTAIDNQGNATIRSFGKQVSVVADLPTESVHNRVVKIINSSEGSAEDTYWSKFVAENGVKGAGYWTETIDPTVAPGMDSSTLPHQLRNTAANVFVFEKADWVDRKVGDEDTNPDPSFVGVKIQQTFFHNNRLGILSEDNVAMSKSGEFYDFYYATALTQTASDPIDINCSTIRPAVLHAIVPTAQGLILFSKNQQFILFSDAEILTPSSAVVRGISNYEMDSNIDPVDVGTHINFVSKTPSYSRVFGMRTRGAEESPIVDDISRIVSEWIPDTVTNLLTSPQNFLIALYGPLDNTMYLHKTYSVGEKTVMQSWFRWDFPGNIQHAAVESDTMWSVVEYKGKYILSSASLTQTPEEKIIITSDGQQVNPHMDLYGAVSSMTYDSTNELTKCYLPTGMKDNATLTPVLVIAGNGTTNFAGVTESGFTITPDRPTNQDHTTASPYFEVPKKNISGLTAADVIVGYKYNYSVELPKTYFKMNPEGTLKDYTASLTVARMKFALGLSSVCSFKVKSKGYSGEIWEGTVADAKAGTSGKGYEVPFLLKEENGIKVTLDGARQASTAYAVTSTDTHSTVTFTTAPTAAEDAGVSNGWKAVPAQKIVITTDTWYDVQPSSDAGQYLADDVPLVEENIFTIPIHQRAENFNMRVFSDSPFPVSLTSMMWEGQYSPRFYRRT